jgi:hypothetical protein
MPSAPAGERGAASIRRSAFEAPDIARPIGVLFSAC